MRHEITPYWVPVLWSINVVIFVLAIWFGMFWWKGLEAWTAELFFFISGYAIVIFMWASMLYPPEFPAGLKCDDYFFGNRKWFFGFQLAVVLLDIPETLLKQTGHLREVPTQYVLFIPVALLITLLGGLSRNRRLHAVLPVA
jgi:hypothetical protein